MPSIASSYAITALEIGKELSNSTPLNGFGLAGVFVAASAIVKLVEEIKATKQECRTLSSKVGRLVSHVNEVISKRTDLTSNEMLDNVAQLEKTLLEIEGKLSKIVNSKKWTQFRMKAQNSDVMQECSRDLDEAWRVFDTKTLIQIQQNQENSQQYEGEYRIFRASDLRPLSRWTPVDGNSAVDVGEAQLRDTGEKVSVYKLRRRSNSDVQTFWEEVKMMKPLIWHRNVRQLVGHSRRNSDDLFYVLNDTQASTPHTFTTYMAPFEGLERWVKKLQLALDMAEVAEFLELHDLNIYHRNGQPNIKLITPDGKVLIGPEGLSKNNNLFSTPSELAYTFYYRSSYGFRLSTINKKDIPSWPRESYNLDISSLQRALDVIPILQSSPRNHFTSRYALEVLNLWSQYFEPNALSWESHWAWLCPEGLRCGDIGYFYLDDRDPHRQEVIFQALGTTNRSEWRFDPEGQEERSRSFQRECYESSARSSTAQDMCTFLSNIPSISSRYGVEMDKLILIVSETYRHTTTATVDPSYDVPELYFHALGTDPEEGQPTPWGYWSLDPHPLVTPENFSYSLENIQNHPGIIAQASLEGVRVYDSIELVSLRFLQLTPDEVELVKLLHHHMQTEEYEVDETLPQYLTLPRNTGPDWGPRARITEIEEA